MKQIFFLILFSCVYALSFSQIDYDNRFKQIIPPVPNAGSIADVSKFSSVDYSGVPNVEVPIYNVNSKAVSVPINLRYNASGIKVRDIASWVGLGWSLSVGGSISRTVIGNPDDRYYDEPGGSGPSASYRLRKGWVYSRGCADA